MMHFEGRHEGIYWLSLLHGSYDPEIITRSAAQTALLSVSFRAQEPAFQCKTRRLSSSRDLDHDEDAICSWKRTVLTGKTAQYTESSSG